MSFGSGTVLVVQNCLRIELGNDAINSVTLRFRASVRLISEINVSTLLVVQYI